MKKRIFTLILTLFIFSLQAQDKKIGAELSEIRKQKNHIDLDIKNVFRGLGSATILYKRTYQSGDLIDVNSIKSIRFLARFNNQIALSDPPSTFTNNETFAAFHPSNVLDLFFGFGLERQKMYKGFVHYYGIDFVGYFNKSDDDISNGVIGTLTVNLTETTDRKLQTLKGGINPFFGIKYYFTDRLSLGVETGFEISYFSQKTTELVSSQQIIGGEFVPVVEELEPFVSNGILTAFNNLRFLTIGYTF